MATNHERVTVVIVDEYDEIAQLIYTSPPNSGPGQVMVLIPEVNGSVIVGIIGAATITRRRVRRL